MINIEITKEVLKHFNYPCKYDSMGQMIFDNSNELMLDVRAWGMIQHIKSKFNPEDLQDALGEFITEAINNEWKKYL